MIIITISRKEYDYHTFKFFFLFHKYIYLSLGEKCEKYNKIRKKNIAAENERQAPDWTHPTQFINLFKIPK